MAVASLALLTTGCGGAECAEGTVEQDGECVLAAHYQCEADEVLRGDECVPGLDCGTNTEPENGECVAEEPVECGANTERDPNENECFVTEEACTENTAFSSDEHQCVPTDEVCQDETYYDEDSGLCYPDAQCQPRDVVSDDGYCVSPGEALYEQAEVIADGVTDPAHGGDPEQLHVDAPGDEIVFGGTMNAPDDDGDPQPFDHFEFEADAGDWFEITLYSAGLPDPMFMVRQEDGDFQQLSAEGTGDDNNRQIAVPEDGTYHLVILSAGEEQEVIAGDNWDYAGTIEQLENEDPEQFKPNNQPLSGTLGQLADNFYYTDDVEEGQEVFVSWGVAPPQVENVLRLWESPDEFDSYIADGSVLEVPESEELYLLADWNRGTGMYHNDYELSLYTTVIPTLDPGETLEVNFEADSGDIARLQYRHRNKDADDGAEIEMLDDDGEMILEDEIELGEIVYHRFENSDEYRVRFEHSRFQWFYDDFVPMVDVIQTEPAETVSVSEGEVLSVLQTNADGKEIYAELLDDDGERLKSGPFGPDEAMSYTVRDDDLDEIEIRYANVKQAAGVTVSTTIHKTEDGPDFTTEEWDVVTLEQNNATDDEVFLAVERDSDGEEIFTGWIETDDRIAVEPDGYDDSYSISYVDLSAGEDADIDVEVVAPHEVDDFNANFASEVDVEQTNDDDHDAIIAVVSDDEDEMYFYDELSPDTEYSFTVEYSGEHTVYHYDLDDTSGLDITTDVSQAVKLETFSVDSDDAPAVAEISHDQSDELEIMVIDDDEGEVITTKSFADDIQHAAAFVGLKDHDHTVSYLDSDGLGLDADDIAVDVNIVVPEEISDMSDTFSGEVNEMAHGEHDFYLVEVSERTDYKVEVKATGDDRDGWVAAYLYRVGHNLISETSSAIPDSSLEVRSEEMTFEADTPYIIRIGNDGGVNINDYGEYELSFEEL